MTSHSLRPIPVEGEYSLSTNDLRICGEIPLGAADKIHSASFFAELAPWLFDLISDTPGTSFNKAFLPSRLERLPAFTRGFLADAVDLLPRTEASRACTMEVSSCHITSNTSMSGHNSPMLGLESSRVTATISAPSELAPEEKWTNYKS
jgi:hypothetical protein